MRLLRAMRGLFRRVRIRFWGWRHCRPRIKAAGYAVECSKDWQVAEVRRRGFAPALLPRPEPYILEGRGKVLIDNPMTDPSEEYVDIRASDKVELIWTSGVARMRVKNSVRVLVSGSSCFGSIWAHGRTTIEVDESAAGVITHCTNQSRAFCRAGTVYVQDEAVAYVYPPAKAETHGNAHVFWHLPPAAE